ncbi:ATP-binding cassette domain-containing protein [Macrococcus carouselicus]|uniref:ABC transporter ATP-binding protein n=1 Tax=Macrococcus carouselicus TaxID=69969 RepID=A0A9Q8FPB7_9STAP|nr:ATP-binding cassette domain-containing protein [Macrococcus carouselicus]TDM00761.1 ABC transporter ATP-binding protein [Macrococcus carouselicus]
MSGDILVRLVEVTKYFRHDQTEQSLLARFVQNEKNRYVSINKVTIHLYKGETMGIAGIAGSGKTVLAQLIAKVIEPNSGRVRNNARTFLAAESSTTHSVSHFIETMLLSYNIPLADYAELKHEILIFAELEDKDKTKVSELTVVERAQLLIALTQFLQPEVVVYNDLTRHLSPAFKKKFGEVIDELVSRDKSVVLMEENPDLMLYKADYVSWLSHGQLRRSGEPGDVLPQYLDYYRQYKGTKEELFDLDYKIRRQTLQSRELKRVNRHTRTYVNEDLRKWLSLSAVLLVLGLVLFTLVLKDVQYKPAVAEQQKVAINKQPETSYTEKYALAAVSKQTAVTFKNKTVAQLPAGSLVEITAISPEDYRIAYDSKEMKIEKKNLIYINPAALYDERSFEELKPYMYSNYVNFHQFFNGFLGASRQKVEDELYPEIREPFAIKLTDNEIYLQFNEQKRVSGIRFPLVNRQEMRKKFNLDDDFWIVKVDNGYAVADFDAQTWLYFRR